MKNTIFFLCLIALTTLISCHGEREGCTDPDAINYDLLAELEDNSCTFPNLSLSFNIKNDSIPIFIGNQFLDSMSMTHVRIDSLSFSISNLIINTDKGDLPVPVPIGIDATYEIEGVKVADLQSLTFDLDAFIIIASADSLSQGDFNTTIGTLTCSNMVGIEILPLGRERIDRLDYELDISLGLDDLIIGNDISDLTVASCEALRSAFFIDN